MDHDRYQMNQLIYMHVQDSAGRLLQQFYRAIEKIESHHEGSYGEGDH